MQFHFIAKLFGATASAINKRMQPKVQSAENDTTNEPTQSGQENGPLYRRYGAEIAGRDRRVDPSFKRVERQSLSRWRMGNYSAYAPEISRSQGHMISRFNRSAVHAEAAEFSQYISSQLKKNILERYVQVNEGHIGRHEAVYLESIDDAPAQIQLIEQSQLLLSDSAPITGVMLEQRQCRDCDFATTIPQIEANLILMPERSNVCGFAKLLDRRRHVAMLAEKKEQSISAELSVYSVPLQECVLPWGEVEVVDIYEGLREKLAAQADLHKPVDADEELNETSLDQVSSQSKMRVMADCTEIERMLQQFDELYYIRYILSPQADLNILERIGEHHCTPPFVLMQLAFHRDLAVRCAVAENTNTPCEALWLLGQDPAPTVRYALAENCHAPKSILNVLTNDDNGYVSSRAQKTLSRLRPVKVVSASFGKSSPLRRAASG